MTCLVDIPERSVIFRRGSDRGMYGKGVGGWGRCRRWEAEEEYGNFGEGGIHKNFLLVIPFFYISIDISLLG